MFTYWIITRNNSYSACLANEKTYTSLETFYNTIEVLLDIIIPLNYLIPSGYALAFQYSEWKKSSSIIFQKPKAFVLEWEHNAIELHLVETKYIWSHVSTKIARIASVDSSKSLSVWQKIIDEKWTNYSVA